MAKVLDNSPFVDFFIPPVPDDSGVSIGSAFFVQHQIMNKPRSYFMKNNYLGPAFANDEIASQLDKWKNSV